MSGVKKKKKGSKGGIRIVGKQETYMSQAVAETWGSDKGRVGGDHGGVTSTGGGTSGTTRSGTSASASGGRGNTSGGKSGTPVQNRPAQTRPTAPSQPVRRP